MKKQLAILFALAMLTNCMGVSAETAPDRTMGVTEAQAGETPPAPPEGGMAPGDGQTPPAMPDGNGGPGGPGGDGQTPPAMPDGNGGPGGMSGGMSAAPTEYAAVTTLSADTSIEGETLVSTGTDENAVLVTGGSTTLANCTVTRDTADSAGGDSASFYGVGAALLATDGRLTVCNSTISTTGNGAAGVFAYGDSVVKVENTQIRTTGNTAGGIHVAGGGTLYAKDLVVETMGESSAAIRSDRGGGTMVIDGGSYTSNGIGSPAIYVTADITVQDATLTANGSEALCLEGLNSVTLMDCELTGSMSDDERNDNTWTVILYQSMSGDSEVGKGSFRMSGGTLTSRNGGIFYTTNTESEFVLSGVQLEAAEDCEYLLRCTGNANQRGWGQSGANGADCSFTAIAQQLDGSIIWDSISTLTLYVTEGSSLTGAVIDDESCAGNGGDGYCRVIIDADSAWTVTGDSTVTELQCEGTLVDPDGALVTVAGTDGTVYVQGTSAYTVTCESYSEHCDLTGVGTIEA